MQTRPLMRRRWHDVLQLHRPVQSRRSLYTYISGFNAARRINKVRVLLPLTIAYVFARLGADSLFIRPSVAAPAD